MITDEQHEQFLLTLDNELKNLKTWLLKDKLDDRHIEHFTNLYTRNQYEKQLPIVWVKTSNPIVTEFYSSELNLTWLMTFVTYLDNLNISNDEIKNTCIYLTFVLLNVKGFNVVDGVVYLLKHDLDFITYNLDRRSFI
jgi:hypothetical protein